MNQIRAVVIDDSAFMRKSISIMLESDGSIKVIGTARDGEEGFKLVQSLNPDIVTLRYRNA
jgi:two-component system chemotaxis response regulator CheB